MRHYLLYMLFLLLLGGIVACSAILFGDDTDRNVYYEGDIPLVASIDTELEDFSDTFAALSDTFDKPIQTSDIIRIERLAADPTLDEGIPHPLGVLNVVFDGRSTTLTVEAEVYREDGTYLTLYLSGDQDVVTALDERIMAYYEELGI